jgi:hypothetical protein
MPPGVGGRDRTSSGRKTGLLQRHVP